MGCNSSLSGFHRTEVKALINNKATGNMELQNRKGYVKTVDGETVVIQKNGNGTYFANLYGMAASLPYSSLKEAQANLETDIRKVKERSPQMVEVARQIYNAIANAGGSMSSDDYLKINREIQRKVMKKR